MILWCIREHQNQSTGLYSPGVSDSVVLWRSLNICFFNKFLGDGDAASQGTTLWGPLTVLYAKLWSLSFELYTSGEMVLICSQTCLFQFYCGPRYFIVVLCWWLMPANSFVNISPAFIVVELILFISCHSLFVVYFSQYFTMKNFKQIRSHFTLNTCITTSYILLWTFYDTWCTHICPSGHLYIHLSLHLIFVCFCVLLSTSSILVFFSLIILTIYFRISVRSFYLPLLLGFEISCCICCPIPGRLFPVIL